MTAKGAVRERKDCPVCGRSTACRANGEIMRHHPLGYRYPKDRYKRCSGGSIAGEAELVAVLKEAKEEEEWV